MYNSNREQTQLIFNSQVSSPQASSKYSTAPSSNNVTKPSTPEADQNFQARVVHLKSSSAKKRLVIRSPNDEMFRRWLKSLSTNVPTVDLTDLSNQVSSFGAKKRQFAPELS